MQKECYGVDSEADLIKVREAARQQGVMSAAAFQVLMCMQSLALGLIKDNRCMRCTAVQTKLET